MQDNDPPVERELSTFCQRNAMNAHHTNRPENNFMNYRDARGIDWQNRDENIRTLQIIVGALIAGLFGFMILMQRDLPQFRILSTSDWIGVFVFLVFTVLSFVLPPALCRSIVVQVENSPDLSAAEQAVQLFGAFQTKTIVGCAFLESAGCLNLTLNFNNGNAIGIALALVCILIIALRFPTRSRVLYWIADRMPNS